MVVAPKEVDPPVEISPPVRQEGSLKIENLTISFNQDTQLVDVVAKGITIQGE